ncbi:MAG: hypothetical protein KDK10_11075 [Maritimibacter sp.]|nr:hypothetical protein [Maritimibacter sp.]
MSRIILHIGTHKTATTSIQKFLDANRAALAERGVFYPDYEIVDQKSHYAHIGMVNALSGAHDVFDEDIARRFFSEVVRRSSDYETTIISAEPFYRHIAGDPNSGPPDDPEEYWTLRRAYIERVRDIFGEARVVVVFRRQAEYAHSLYQEHVKATRYKGNFHTFLDEFWYHFAFFKQAQAWNAGFSGLKALTFDRLVRSGDAVAEFCRLLALPIDGLNQPKRANEGLPVDLVALKRILNASSADRLTLRKQFGTLETALSTENRELMKGRSFFDSEDDLVAFQESFAAENEKLRRFLLHDDAAVGPVFPTSYKPGLTYGDRITPDVLQDMIQLAIKWIKSEGSPFRRPRPSGIAKATRILAPAPDNAGSREAALPAFLLAIGPQHEGMSWLARQLARHPEFMLPEIEETQYWNRRFYPEVFRSDGLRERIVKQLQENTDDAWANPELEQALMFQREQYYRAFFEARLTEAHRAFGEFGAAYCVLNDQELARIADVMRPYPMRALFVMRDPTEQLWTRCKAQYARAQKRGQNFDPYHAFSRHMAQPDIWARNDYTVTIRNLERTFAEDERRFVFFDDLATPENFDAICDFLGIGRVELDPASFPKEDETLKRPSSRKWKKVRTSFAPVYDFVGTRMGRLPAGWNAP